MRNVKNILTIILALALSITMVFSFTSCDETYTVTETDGMINELKSAISANKLELDGKIAALTAEYKAKDDAILAEIAANKANLSEHKLAYASEISALKIADAEIQASITSLIAEYNAKVILLDKADAESRAALEALDAKYAKEIGELKAEAATIKESITALTQKHENDIKELEGDDAEILKSISSLTEEFNTKLSALQKEDEEINASILALDKKYEEEVNALKESGNDTAEALLALETKYNSEVKALQDADVAITESIASLTEEYGTRMSALELASAENKAEIEKLNGEYTAKMLLLDKADADNMKAISDLDSKYTSEVNTIKADTKALSDELSALIGKCEDDIALLQTKSNENATLIQNLTEAYEAKVLAIEASITAANSKIDANKKDLENAINGINNVYSSKILNIENLLKELENSKTSQATEISELRDHFNQQLAEIQQKHTQEINALTNQLEALNKLFTYTVVFDSNGGSSVDSQSVFHGNKVTEPEPPTKEDCTFLGWYYGNEAWDFDNSPVYGSIVLTAKWQSPFDPNVPTTITFYHSMGKNLQDVLNASIKDFKNKYPNITVEHKSYGSYDGVLSQVKTELTVGNHPDLALGYADHAAIYNLSGAVQALDVFITDETYGFSGEELNNFIPGFLDDGKVFGGDTYLLPFAQSTDVFYYNKTFFEENNLSVPTTWEELEAVCRKIKEIDPSCIPLGYDSESNWFITMAEQYKSSYTDGTAENPFTFNNEANRAFVETFRTWYQDRLVTTEQLSGGYTSALFTGASDSGTRCYMCIGSTGGAIYQQPQSSTDWNGEIKFEFEVGISVLPQVDKANPKVISQGPNVCIFKDNDPQKVLASWLFAKHLATDEMFQAELSMSSGYVPVIKSVQQNEVYADFLAAVDENPTANIEAYAVKVAIEQTNAMFVSDAFYGSAVAREQVGMLIQKCLAYEGADVKAAIKSAFEAAVAECIYQTGNKTTLESGLNAVKTFLDETYKNFNTAPTSDYDLPAKTVASGVTYEVTWTSDNPAITVKASSKANYWTIDIPDANATETTYKLTATIKAPDGTTTTLELTRTLPVYNNVGIVTELKENTPYKMYLVQKTLSQTLFALNTTQSNNKYINTTNDPKAAADYYIEIVDGGYKFFTNISGVKNYVYAQLVTASDGHFSKYIGFSTTEGSVFTYDSTLKMYFVEIDGAKYGVGTYSSFNTICISDESRFNANSVGNTQFVIGFMDKAYAESLTPDEEKEVEIKLLDGAVAPVEGTKYVIGFHHGGKENAAYYLTGAMGSGSDSYYADTVTDITKAANFYIENVTGGFNLYAIASGEKVYVNFVQSGSYTNIKYEATATTVFTYDETLKTFKTTIGEDTFILGTSAAKTFTTVGPVKAADTNYYVQFAVSTNAGQTKPEGGDQGGNQGGSQGGTTTTGALIDAVIDNAIPTGLTYITNNASFPDPSFYSDGGLKLNFVNQSVQTANFEAQSKVKVTLIIKALKVTAKTETSVDIDPFTVYGLNAAGDVVATATIKNVAEGNIEAVLEGTGIVAVKVIMTDYYNNGTICNNISLGGVKVETTTATGGDQGGV